MPIPHVGYPGAALRLVGHAAQGGQPRGDEAGRVPGPEEPLASEVDIVVVPVPSQPCAFQPPAVRTMITILETTTRWLRTPAA